MRNEYFFTTLDDFDLRWTITDDGVPVDSGVVQPRVAPGDSAIVSLGYRLPTAQRRVTSISSTWRWCGGPTPGWCRRATPWRRSSSRCRCRQLSTPIAAATLPALTMTHDSLRITVTGGDMVARFDLRQGTLASLRFRGTELIRRGPAPNLWRPATDNDWGNGLPRARAGLASRGREPVGGAAAGRAAGAGRGAGVVRPGAA